MGYGLMRTYGLWYENPHPPSQWIAQGMGYEGLWVNKCMGYKGFDCTITSFAKEFTDITRPNNYCGTAVPH